VPVPTALSLSSDAGNDDYPAIASGPQGRVTVVFQQYTGSADRLVIRELQNGAFGSETIEAPETRDVFRPAAAYDGRGILHLVWSAQIDGEWELYARHRGAQGWSAIERVTSAAGPDIYPRLATAPDGTVWLAWQAFRNGQSDILLRPYANGAWGNEIKISESAANDWEPALSIAPDGAIWVAWDSYDRGNYDIFARSVRGGVPGPIRAVTKSPRFEARPSIACDRGGRVWIAFEEGEANWGKDYGYLFKDRGNPLYQSRGIRLVQLNGDRVEEPVQPISSAFPQGMPEMLHSPRIAIDSAGVLTIVAQQLSHANRVLEVWGAQGVWEQVSFSLNGAGWTPAVVLPGSTGPNEARAAMAVTPQGTYAVWGSDNRSFTNGAPQRQTIHAALLQGASSAANPIGTRAFAETPELSFPAHLTEAADLRAVRGYRIQSGGKQYRILRGDLHRHTALSQDGVGDGSLWDFYRYMLDAASMDFSTVTDHQGGGNPYNWYKTQKSTDLFFLPRHLTTMYAYERSVVFPNGHRNIVFLKKGAPILPIVPGEQQQGRVRSSDQVLPYLRQYGALAFRHTTATNQGTDWADHNNELEPLVEIYQGHRVVYEHEGGPKGATAGKVYLQRSGYQPTGFVWNALAKGYRMGIQASSDHCSTHVSYSCILAENDSREAIMDAMRKRHTYGAMDNIVVDFRVKTPEGERMQGDDFRTAGRYTLTFKAIGTGPIRRVDVIHNEQYVYSLTPGTKTVEFSYSDPHPVSGENRYYVRLEQENGLLAWSSPVWVQFGTK
jgi:hypothetical protein